MSTTERPQSELDGMPERPKLPRYDGQEFGTIKVALSGGCELDLGVKEHRQLLEALVLGDDVTLLVHGEVSAKRPSIAHDREGFSVPKLTITVNADDVTLAGEGTA